MKRLSLPLNLKQANLSNTASDSDEPGSSREAWNHERSPTESSNDTVHSSGDSLELDGEASARSVTTESSDLTSARAREHQVTRHVPSLNLSASHSQVHHQSAQKDLTNHIPIDYLITDITCSHTTNHNDVQSELAKVWFQQKSAPPPQGSDHLFEVHSYTDHVNRKRLAVSGAHESTQISFTDLLKLAKERDVYKQRAEQSETTLGALQSELSSMEHRFQQASSSESTLRSENDILRQKLKHYEKLRTDMLNTVESLKAQHGLLIKAIVTSKTPRPPSKTSRTHSENSLKDSLVSSKNGSQSARI